MVVLEKDYKWATMREASDFIVQTNCDCTGSPAEKKKAKSRLKLWLNKTHVKLDHLVEGSEWSAEAVKKKWERVKRDYERMVIGLGIHDH